MVVNIMRTTQELYKFDPKLLADMNYKEALIFKLDALNHLLGENSLAISVTYNYSHLSELDAEYRMLNKAIAFNEQLLDELKG